MCQCNVLTTLLAPCLIFLMVETEIQPFIALFRGVGEILQPLVLGKALPDLILLLVSPDVVGFRPGV